MTLIVKDGQVLTPAFGRDYPKASEVRADFLNGKLFVLNSPEYGFGYVTFKDFMPGVAVSLRYAHTCKKAKAIAPMHSTANLVPREADCILSRRMVR